MDDKQYIASYPHAGACLASHNADPTLTALYTGKTGRLYEGQEMMPRWSESA